MKRLVIKFRLNDNFYEKIYFIYPLFHSLNINPSGNMIFNCDITMPYQSNIEINGTTSINNNSNIHSIQDNWGTTVIMDAMTISLDTGFECTLGGVFESISH